MLFPESAEWYEILLVIFIMVVLLFQILQFHTSYNDMTWLRNVGINGLYRLTAIRNMRQAAIRIIGQLSILAIALRLLTISGTPAAYLGPIEIPPVVVPLTVLVISIVINSIYDYYDRQKIMVASVRRSVADAKSLDGEAEMKATALREEASVKATELIDEAAHKAKDLLNNVARP